MAAKDNTTPAIDCVEFVRMVDELVDTDPKLWGAVVAKHLEDCPPCLVYLQQMLDLKVLLDLAFTDERLDDEGVAAVIDSVNSLRNGQ
jgi:hypothetical protein